MKLFTLSCVLATLTLVPNDVRALGFGFGAEGAAPASQSGTDVGGEGGARAERRERGERRGRDRRRGPRRRGPIQRLPAEQRQAALELARSARAAATPLVAELQGLRDEARRRMSDLGPGADAEARAALRKDLRARAVEARKRHAPNLGDHGRRLVELLPAEARARLHAASKARAEARGDAWSDTLLHERIGLRLALGAERAERGHGKAGR